MKKKTELIERVEDTPAFKGYTIEEIRYQRAMMALRKEFCKAKLTESVSNLRGGGKRDVFKSGAKKTSKLAVAGKIASRIFSNLNTIDYVLMGISLFGTARKGLRLLRGKK